LGKYEDILRMWQGFRVASEADIDLRLHHFSEAFAYHSGRIENDEVTWHDTHEIFANGRVTNFTGNPRALFEQRNQKLCYELLKTKLAACEPLSLGLILEIHRVLTEGTYDERRYIALGERPGAFKKNDFIVGHNEVGSMPEDVEANLSELIDELNNARNLSEPAKVFKAAVYFHMGFEYIHPFADGNGRVGRTLMNYFLMVNDHLPLVVFDEDKTEYYDALERFDEGENLEPLHTFMRGQLEKTWAKAIEKHRKRHQGGTT